VAASFFLIFTGQLFRWSKQPKAILPVIITIVSLFWFMAAGEAFAVTPRYQEPITKNAIIELTNNIRATEGLAILEENPLLDTIAEARARDILDKQYFGHVSPTGEQASHIAIKIGYKYKIIAENLASGAFFTNSKIVDCWMQSPGHRKNILSSQMREIGVSVIKGRLNGAETWVSVQIFGLRSTPAPIGSYTFARHESGMEIGAEAPAGEGLHEKLIRMKQEVDAERAMIERNLRIAGNDSAKNEEHALRVRSYNEKLDKYNQALAEIQSIRMAMNSRK